VYLKAEKILMENGLFLLINYLIQDKIDILFDAKIKLFFNIFCLNKIIKNKFYFF
jgi:hypothetical protein